MSALGSNDSQEVILADCDEAIRNGQMDRARASLLSLENSKLHRKHLVTAAGLARRLGLHTFGLRLLRSVVRPKTSLREPASEAELSIYAALLIKIGAVEEALEILSRLATTFDRHLYTAFAYQSQWNYSAAIHHLQLYLQAEVTDYQKAIARVNLASAMVNVGDESAEDLLRKLFEETQAQGWKLLHSSSLEIAARMAISNQNWSAAESYLDQARQQLSGDSNVLLFTKKWRALLEVKRTAGSPESLKHLTQLQLEAFSAGHWETLRECDLYRAYATSDEDLFNHVYYGTPYESYREDMRRASSMKIAETYILGTKPKKARIFDLSTAQAAHDDSSLKPGQKLHGLLLALTKDFYRPVLIGALAADLFPDEYYDPDHSPKRISDLVARLRSWAQDENWGITIEATNGAYQLKVGEGFGLAITKAMVAAPVASLTSDSKYERLLQHFKDEAFTAKEASLFLGQPIRTINSILQLAVESGAIERTGKARATRYQRSRK